MDADTITTFGRSPPPSQALDLAQTRYSLGLSSVIELSQAELNQTEARIEQAPRTITKRSILIELSIRCFALTKTVQRLNLLMKGSARAGYEIHPLCDSYRKGRKP
jgi:hypothetical protein